MTELSIMPYRSSEIEGKTIRLLPFSMQYAEDVIRLRNTERARYFLNQSFESTLDGQREWFEEYLTRDNDIYWVIFNGSGDFVGTTALYNIDFIALKAEKGRLNTDEAITTSGPFVLEAELLLLRFAFKELGLKTIYTTVREDNVKMQSVNRKLGFEYKYTIDIRDVPYHYYELSADDYNPESFEPILEHWRKRYERAKA